MSEPEDKRLRKMLNDIHNRSALIGGGFVSIEEYDWHWFQRLVEADYVESNGNAKFRPSVEGLNFLLEARDDS